MLRRWWMTCWMILMSGLVLGQEVHFSVVENETEIPIPGALIVFNDNKHILTNWKGEADIICKKPQDFLIKMLGFQDGVWHFDPQQVQNSIIIRLTPTAAESATLVVSSSLYGQSVKENSQSIERIDARDLVRKRTVDISSALERVPGVTVVDGQASIRGGSGYAYGAGSRVMLVMDDVPLLTADRNDVKWNYVPIEMMEAMEVVKGASSVQYGSSALNGVVNIRTKTPQAKPNGMLQYYFTGYDAPSVKGAKWWGSADTSNSGNFPYQSGYLFRYGQQTGNCKWLMGGAVHTGEGWIRGEEEKRVRWSFKTKWNLPQYKRTQWGVNGLVMRQRLNSSLFWQDQAAGSFISSSATASYNDLWMNVDPWIEHTDRKGNLHTIKGRYYASMIPNAKHLHHGVQLEQISYRWVHRTQWGMDWLAGANINHFSFTDAAFGGFQQGNLSGAFTQGDYSWRKWHFSSGMRLEHYAMPGVKMPPIPVGRMGATYAINDRHILRASYVQGYRFPSPAERFVRYTIDQINIYPNPDIVPEHGWGSELGYKAIIEKEAFQASFDAALFLTRYRDLIEFTFGRWGAVTDTLFGLGYKSVNVADAQIGGAEFSGSINGKLNGWEWHGLGGYTYILPVDLSQYPGGKNLFKYGQSLCSEISGMDTSNYILRYRFKHMAKFNLDASRGKWGLGMGWRYYSFMQKIDPVLEWFIPGLSDYRKTHQKGTQIWDFRLHYYCSENFSCSLQAQNVFNAFYATRPAKPDAPRNISVQFTWQIH